MSNFLNVLQRQRYYTVCSNDVSIRSFTTTLEPRSVGQTSAQMLPLLWSWVCRYRLKLVRLARCWFVCVLLSSSSRSFFFCCTCLLDRSSLIAHRSSLIAHRSSLITHRHGERRYSASCTHAQKSCCCLLLLWWLLYFPRLQTALGRESCTQIPRECIGRYILCIAFAVVFFAFVFCLFACGAVCA